MPVRVLTIVKKTRYVTVKATPVGCRLSWLHDGQRNRVREGARGGQISDPFGPGVEREVCMDCLLYKQFSKNGEPSSHAK